MNRKVKYPLGLATILIMIFIVYPLLINPKSRSSGELIQLIVIGIIVSAIAGLLLGWINGAFKSAK